MLELNRKNELPFYFPKCFILAINKTFYKVACRTFNRVLKRVSYGFQCFVVI